MRFIEGGPSIPDELLSARDEGRLVIFCGAGVSQAKADMPNFINLAETVANTLGVPQGDQIRSVLSEITTIGARTGVNGLISADIVFDRLEQSFSRRDIDRAVAQALNPPKAVDLSAHKMLIDLARTPTGNVRIVTSNFERLFEKCSPELAIYSPVNLPDFNRVDDFNGIVHNHGIVNDTYTDSSGDGFVLSSSEFGKAYLADGWATRFIRSVLEKYVVLFVGYTADDPPVKYLLQGLNRIGDSKNTLYAFHSGTTGEADASWSTKGVEAIAYDPDDKHRYLWETLDAWRNRAVDVDAWYEQKFLMAEQGPEKLSSHQRGQIAHIVSTRIGAKKLADRNVPIPATWLCVFDSTIRFLKPGDHGHDYNNTEWIDPFELYGIDEDVVPKKVRPEDQNVKREIPSGAWDAFRVDEKELVGNAKNNVSALSGYYSVKSPPMPDRLFYIGCWVEKISDQVALLWWAGRKLGLHEDIQFRIKNAIDKKESLVDSVLRSGWEFMFDVWSNVKPLHDFSWHQLKDTVAQYGWSDSVVRRFSDVTKPHFVIKPSWRNIKPPENFDGNLSQVIGLDVKYLDYVDELQIDIKFMLKVIKALVANIQLADELEKEIGGYGMLDDYSVRSIVARNDLKGSHYNMTVLIDLLIFYFNKLLNADPLAAKLELSLWNNSSVGVFSKIKIWAIGQIATYSDDEASQALSDLTNEEFWDVNNQEDLLTVLAARWEQLTAKTLVSLQEKILSGTDTYEGESAERFRSRKAWRSLERIVWMANNGCNFSFDLEQEKQKLIGWYPTWKDEDALNAAANSSGLRSGSVSTDKNYVQLMNAPLSEVIDRAESEAGWREDPFVEKDPFKGLVEQRPVRAFLALVSKSKIDVYPDWAWQAFLSYDLRKNDSPRFVIAIANRLIRLPSEVIVELVHSLSSWVNQQKFFLFNHSPDLFYQLYDVLVNTFELDIETTSSSITGSSVELDWISMSINSPIGTLTEAVLSDPSSDGLESKSGFPLDWLSRLEKLISCGNSHGYYALVIIARNMHWLYSIDPVWTENNLLSKLDESIVGDAIWSGFLWSGNTPQTDLYIAIKSELLNLVSSNRSRRRKHVESLAAFILAGWLRQNKEDSSRLISNDEMRDVLLMVGDDFRSQLIGIYERWLKGKDGKTDQVMVHEASEFFSVVWPKQIKVKSPQLSAKLFDLSLNALGKIDGIEDMVLPLMTLNESARIRSSHFLHIDEDSVVSQYPEECLKLLNAILSTDAKNWPHGVDRALPKFIEFKPELKSNSMYIELKRRWDSRS